METHTSTHIVDRGHKTPARYTPAPTHKTHTQLHIHTQNEKRTHTNIKNAQTHLHKHTDTHKSWAYTPTQNGDKHKSWTQIMDTRPHLFLKGLAPGRRHLRNLERPAGDVETVRPVGRRRHRLEQRHLEENNGNTKHTNTHADRNTLLSLPLLGNRCSDQKRIDKCDHISVLERGATDLNNAT